MTTFAPLVSVVIPVYNGANYLAQAIDSALAQSYPHIEVLVINDGSTDEGSTAAIARSYGDRIRYLEKPNGGVATALNLGIEEMKGEYFSWLSHDDLFLPEKLSRQVQFLAKAPNREVVLYSDYRVVDARGQSVEDVRLDHEMLLAKPLYAVLRASVHGCSTLIPGQALRRFGGFDVTLATTQDYDLWFRMARELPFIHQPDVLICSRSHDQQGSKVDSRVASEANALWTGFATSLSRGEMLACEPSVYLFYQRLSCFLATTPYHQACAEVRALAEAERARSDRDAGEVLVTVILTSAEAEESTLEPSLSSVLSQSHGNLEVIIVAEREHGVQVADPRVRFLEAGAGSVAAQRNAAGEQARGRYVAFLESGRLWKPDKIAVQLRRMLWKGSLLSFTASGARAVSVRPGARLPEQIARGGWDTSTVMVLFGETRPVFREQLEYAADICLWWDLSREGSVDWLETPLVSKPSLKISDEVRVRALLELAAHISAHSLRSGDLGDLTSVLATAARLSRRMGLENHLSEASRGSDVWPRARLCNALARNVGRFSKAVPRICQPPGQTLARMVLASLSGAARMEARLRRGAEAVILRLRERNKHRASRQ